MQYLRLPSLLISFYVTFRVDGRRTSWTPLYSWSKGAEHIPTLSNSQTFTCSLSVVCNDDDDDDDIVL